MAGKRVFICTAPEDSGYYVGIIAAPGMAHAELSGLAKVLYQAAGEEEAG
jgi:hypothetical protein